jgi:hypothetical protein
MQEKTKVTDGRPDNVCQKCGYAVCCCSLQNNAKQPQRTVVLLPGGMCKIVNK